MTTSIDPSIDELLLLQENQYHMSNMLLSKIKPIGAERKIGQTMTKLSTSSEMYPTHIEFELNNRKKEENNHYFNSFDITSSNKSTLTSVYDQLDFSSFNELESPTYPSFSNYSSSSPSLTSAYSTVPSIQSVSHSLENSIYQRQMSTSSSFLHQHQSLSTITGKIEPSFSTIQNYPINRFNVPQQYTGNSFTNNSQRISLGFSVPSQCTRERFQVNSIGRPIFRTNTYHNYLKIRR